MPDGPSALEEAYSAVKGIVTEVEQYVKVGLWFVLRGGRGFHVEVIMYQYSE